jgi:hypothetical protein
VFQEEDLEEGFDFTGCEKTPCRIEGNGGMVYWENCNVENWKSGHGTQVPELVKRLSKRRGKGTLSTGEYLTFTGQGGKAKKG